MLNCNDCKYVNLTEKQQIAKTIDHKCLKHGCRLFHRSNNPKIHHTYLCPYKQCNGENFEQRL